jgi:hypothetical protein
MCGGDMACAQNCQGNASQEANTRLQAVFSCAQNNQCVNQADGSINQQCLEDNCAIEVGACFGGGGGRATPMGNGTCDDFWNCLGQCPQAPGGGTDEACLNQCIASSSQAGFDQAIAVSACVGDSNCPEGDGACYERECPNEFLACFGEPAMPMGAGGCYDMLECFGDDNTTQNECIEATSPAAYGLFEAITACSAMNGCDTDACITANCQAEVRACYDDGRMWGMANCGTTYDCVLACPQDAMGQACAETCIDAANGDAFFLVQDAFACIETNMCMDPAMCPACDAQVAACRAAN